MRELQYRNKYANLFALIEEPRSPDRPESSTGLVDELKSSRYGEFTRCCASRCYSNIKNMLGK